MKYAVRIFIMLLAILALLLTVASCKKKENGGKGDAEELPSDYPYYANNNFNGQNFRIFNISDKCWGMVTVLDPEDTTDEVRHNIYRRNEFVKTKLNCTITEESNTWKEWEMNQGLEQSILAGPAYDAASMPLYHCKSMIPAGYYQCLNDIDTLHLDQPWWNSAMLETTSLCGKNYAAVGSVQLMSYDSMYLLFFNEDMMEDMGMDKPYDLVRNGEWTWETYLEYCRKAMNLNGDNTYAMDGENATFGCVSLNNIYPVWVYSLGGLEIVKDGNDEPILNIEDRSYGTVCQTVADYLVTPGVFLMGEDFYQDDYYFEKFFPNQRCLFTAGWLSEAQSFRSSVDDEFTYGILPFPTLEPSKEYKTTCWYQTCGFSVPLNSPTPDNVCLLVDALGYESEKTVVQPYFAKQVEQKGLKNQDSIDMLNILRKGCSFDLGYMYQWARDFEVDLTRIAEAGEKADVAAKAKSYADLVQDQINKTMDWISKQ